MANHHSVPFELWTLDSRSLTFHISKPTLHSFSPDHSRKSTRDNGVTDRLHGPPRWTTAPGLSLGLDSTAGSTLQASLHLPRFCHVSRTG
jgi:hypothetical protein